MAYDEDLADRIREALQGQVGVVEKRMFGGLAFLVNGNMAVAASGQGGLMLRVEPAATGGYLDVPGVSRMEMRGREMNGWLRIDTSAVEQDADLRRWVAIGVAYAGSLTAK